MELRILNILPQSTLSRLMQHFRISIFLNTTEPKQENAMNSNFTHTFWEDKMGLISKIFILEYKFVIFRIYIFGIGNFRMHFSLSNLRRDLDFCNLKIIIS